MTLALAILLLAPTLLLADVRTPRAYLAQLVGSPTQERVHLRAPEEESALALLSLPEQLRFRPGNLSCRDNGVIGDLRSLFLLSPDGRVRNASGELLRLDRELLCEQRLGTCWLNFTVMFCSDLVDLAVEIVDVNDWQPVFSVAETQLEFSEADEPFAAPKRLPLASDRDGPAFTVRKYSLRKGNNTDPFCITASRKPSPTRCDGVVHWNANYTDLYLVQNGRLDRETRAEYRLELVAEDSNNKVQLSLLVLVNDVNDHAPRFSPASYSVSHNEQPSGEQNELLLVQVNASDADVGSNAELAYSLEWSLPEDVNQFLDVNDLGEIRARNGLLDFERHSSFSFRVLATDNKNNANAVSRTGTAEVTVNLTDINDNAPVVKVESLTAQQIGDDTIQFSVNENGAEQQFVARLIVSDADVGENGRFSCTVTPEATAGRSALLVTRTDSAKRNTEYQIKTARALDREQQPEHSLSLRCADNGRPQLESSVRLVVRVTDANDHAPRFGSPVYTVSVPEEPQPSDRPIATFDVTDADDGINGDLHFWLDANVSAQFRMHNNELLLARPLDRETQADYTFPVFVRDRGEPSMTASALVRLQVTDVNDNAPQLEPTLHIEVSESIGIESLPHLVHTVKVRDADAPGTANSNISFMLLEDGPFIVDKHGNLFLNARLDREAKESYQFQLLAYDHGVEPLTSTCTVSVTVVDANDMAPVFVRPQNNRTIVRLSLPLSSEYAIVHFEARDYDAPGPNSRVTYSIDSRDDDIFSINNTSGQLFMRRIVSGGMIRHVKVVARDGGRPALSSTVVHTIELIGIPPTMDNREGYKGDGNRDYKFETDENPPRERSDTIYIICAIVIGISACLAIFIIILILLRNRRYQRDRRAHVEEAKAKQRTRARRPKQGPKPPGMHARPQSRNEAGTHHSTVFNTNECHLNDQESALKVSESECDGEKPCNLPLLPTSPLTVDYELENASRAAQLHGGFLQSNLLMNPQATLAQPPFLSPYKMTAFCIDCDACRQSLKETANTQPPNRTDRYQFSRPSSSATNKRPIDTAMLTYQVSSDSRVPRSTSAVLRRLETAASSKEYNSHSEHNSSECSSASADWDDDRTDQPASADPSDVGALPTHHLECNNNDSIVSGMMTNLNANRVRTKSVGTVGSHKIAVQEVRPFVFDLQTQIGNGPFETVTMPHSTFATTQPYRANSAGLMQNFKPLKNLNFEHSFV